MTRGAGGRLYCPYCYEAFTEQGIQFRCAGGDGRGCQPEVDTVLRDRIGYAGALPPVFTADGRQTSAPCPRCGLVSSARVCPCCHSRLPALFGKVTSRLIALVGAKQSGKTVFMTVLLHELMHDLGLQLNSALNSADDDTHRFTVDYEAPLYHESVLLPPTPAAGLRNRVPLVYRFTTGGRPGWSRRLARADDGPPRHTLLSFFDAAGEDLRSQQSVEQNLRYLAAADGIILVLDPLQLPGARERANPGTLLPTPAAPDDQPATVLENITNLLLATQEGGKPGARIRKPLAIVFSKMDALTRELKPTSPLLRPPPRTLHLAERDSLEVHHEIRRLLDRWGGSRIDQIARLHYSTYRYSGVSALGETPTAGNEVSPRGIRPLRIGDPFMWVLAEFGVIQARRD
jgi:hypothetical protein